VVGSGGAEFVGNLWETGQDLLGMPSGNAMEDFQSNDLGRRLGEAQGSNTNVDPSNWLGAKDVMKTWKQLDKAADCPCD
jgi:hypothetical protein